MNWIRRRETWLSIGGGILAALSMPGFGVSPLVFVALVPLFFALRRRPGFGQGYLFGLAFFAVDVRWVLSLTRFNPLVALGYPLLIAYLAIPFGLIGWLAMRRRDKIAPWKWIVLVSALLVLAEFVRTVGPLGMGFSMLYEALYRVPWLIQSASIFGSWSITAFVAAINAALYVAWRKKQIRYALVAVGLFLAQAAFWLVPLALDEADHALAVAAVSSNVDQQEKLDARNLAALTDRFIALGEEALEGNPDLIVFPESFLPAYILDVHTVFTQLADLATNGNAQLLFGTGTYRASGIFNSTVLVDIDGRVVDRYDMVRPVPFGEYIPGRRLLEAIGLGAWLDTFLPIDLSRGDRYEPLEAFGTPICFESTFPTASRRLTAAGAELLVTLTNDAWFAGSSELETHFATAVFRAVENRRATVQVANGGISGFVDRRGRILWQTNLETVSTRQVRLSSAHAPYTRYSDLPFVLLALCAALLALVFPSCRRKRQTGAQDP